MSISMYSSCAVGNIRKGSVYTSPCLSVYDTGLYPALLPVIFPVKFTSVPVPLTMSVYGVIHEDKLGFNLIYIQAKRWNPDVTIGKPEIQKFFGAMMGPPRVEKGLFITTAKFSKGAKEYADAQHIILVDGQKLTSLMIECGLGVSVQKVYQIKRIDSDYFSDSL